MFNDTDYSKIKTYLLRTAAVFIMFLSLFAFASCAQQSPTASDKALSQTKTSEREVPIVTEYPAIEDDSDEEPESPTTDESSSAQTEDAPENAESSADESYNTQNIQDVSSQETIADGTDVSEEYSAPSYSTTDYSDTILIGDSIMVLTSAAVEDMLPNVTIDASSGRSLEIGGPNEGEYYGNGVFAHVEQHVGQYRRYIIGTGNNDYNGMDYDSGLRIVTELADADEIFFVTEYVSNNTAGTRNTNSTIWALADEYDNVHVIDWHSVVTAHESEYLQGDNCHPQTTEAQYAYAELVKEALDSV